jgi:predicted TIM-barrel fold metal-dependent hydrolase
VQLGSIDTCAPQDIFFEDLCAQICRSNGWLTNAIAFPLETSTALAHMIFEVTFDKFPKLKVIAAHGGGFLPSYADRSDHACLVNPSACNPGIKLTKQPTEYLKQIYFDSLVFTPEALRHLAAQVGVSQIVLGSDYPFPWQLQPVDHIFAPTSFSDDEKADMLGRNAESCWISGREPEAAG